MRFLDLRPRDVIHVGDDIEISYVKSKLGSVKLAITAPAGVHIDRGEVSAAKRFPAAHEILTAPPVVPAATVRQKPGYVRPRPAVRR